MQYKDLINKLGFDPKENTSGIFCKKYSKCDDYCIEIDIEKGKFDFGNLILAESKTTQNFSQAENWVIVECVDRLLEKGYAPKNIKLEKTWATGHGTSGRLDILVTREDGSAYLMIECKTYGSEFDKEYKRILKDGGQLFTYFQQDNNAEILMLYASELDGKGNIQYVNEIVKIEEDYRQAGNVKDFYDRWNKLPKNNGVFDEWVAPYDFKSQALTPKTLKDIKQVDSSFIFNRFLEILRHNVVSDKPNAFNKIFTLFLCKIYDEKSTPKTKELGFQWLEGTDTHISFQKRLADLYKKGMKEFLDKEVSDLSDKEFEEKFGHYILDDTTKQKILDQFTELRLKKNNEFAIKEVFDDSSFEDNAKVVKEVVELLQGYKIRYTKRHQYLSDFFEMLLTTGLKQESGQFFTPVPVAQFIIKSLPLDKIVEEKLNAGEVDNLLPSIIDYAAGSGHFLTESMHEVQQIIDSKKSDDYIESTGKQIKKWQLDHFDWAIHYVYGIEKDYRLVKVGKVGCYLHGDGLAKVIHSDGLANFTQTKDYQGKLNHKDKFFPQDNKQFDVVISNPPYSVSSFKGTLKNVETEFDLFDDLTDQSSQIECLFVERTKQLLKDGGVAGIILPSSVLNNTGIYTRTREIIFQYFEIVAIAELGSNTFMATDTNTVTLFLRRRKNDASKNIKLLTERFTTNLKDVTINGIEKPVSKYVEHVWEGITYNDYLSLLENKPNDTIKAHEIYKEYLKKINAKNAVDQWNEIIKREQDKLYYFTLIYPQKIVLVKTGEKNEEKQFLGYEFSTRRGSEGIHPVQKEKSIEECTQLFDPNIFENPLKASTYIYQAFSGKFDTPIDPSLEKNVSRIDLINMMNFEKADFEKSISLSSKKKVKYEEVWGTSKLDYLQDISDIKKGTSITKDKAVDGDIPVIAGGQGFAYMHNISNREGNIITVSASGAYSGYVSYYDYPIFASDCNTIKSLNEEEFPTKLLFLFLKYLQPYIYDLQRGQAQPHVYGDDLAKIKIPVLNKTIKKSILEEVSLLEKNEATLKRKISVCLQSIKEEIDALFSNMHQSGKIEDYFNVNQLTANPKTTYKENLFTYVDIDSIEKGTGNVLYDQKIKGTTAPSRARRIVENGSMIISTVRPYLKGFAFLKEVPPDTIFSTGFAVLKSMDESKYITRLGYYYFMYSSNLMAQMEEKMPKASYPSINKDDIDNFKIPKVDPKDQLSVVLKVEKLEHEIKDLENAITDIPNQKELILAKYIK